MAKKFKIERDIQIRAYAQRLAEVKEFGKQKHSIDWILAKTAAHFYLSEATIKNIMKAKTDDRPTDRPTDRPKRKTAKVAA